MTTVLDYIEGFAVRYTVWSDDPVGNPPRSLYLEAGSFVRGDAPIHADCEHQPEYTFADTASGSLWVGEDDVLGLKFRAAIAGDFEGENLLRRLRGRFERGAVRCSVGLIVHDEDRDGSGRAIVRSFSIDHVTLTMSPAFGGTLAWLAGTPDEFTAPRVQEFRRHFHAAPPPRRSPVVAAAPVSRGLPSPTAWPTDLEFAQMMAGLRRAAPRLRAMRR